MPILGIIASSRLGVVIPAPSLWLDASDAGTFTYSSGTIVSQWTDKSSNAYQFTNSTTGNQPNRNGSQNGLATVSWDGTNDTLYESNKSKSLFKYFHDGTGATLFVVAKHNSTALNERYTIGTMTDGFGQTGFVGGSYYYGSLAYYPSTGASTATTGADSAKSVDISTTFANNAWEIRTNKFDQNNATTSLKMQSYLNLGAATGSTTGANWTTASTANAYGWLAIGAVNDGTNIRYWFLGEIAEILAYNSVFSDAQKDKVVNDLKTKWGI